MVDLGCELDLGRLEGVVGREVEVPAREHLISIFPFNNHSSPRDCSISPMVSDQARPIASDHLETAEQSPAVDVIIQKTTHRKKTPPA